MQVSVGSDRWIGAGAIVMADVGSRTTVGAGQSLPAHCPMTAYPWEIPLVFSAAAKLPASLHV